MNVLETHGKIIEDYANYIRSFINIKDEKIAKAVEQSLSDGRLWPKPLLQFNPAYKTAGSVEDAIAEGLMHADVSHIFKGFNLYQHQREAIALGVRAKDFVVTSGTGSGKSLTYLGSIFHHLLSNPQPEGVVAVIVYPMNALINSQTNEITTYKENFEQATGRDFPITFEQYTGQQQGEERTETQKTPPQILLTNYMMLELLLTRAQERTIRDAIFANLKFLVFDELHTYRGRQGADVAMLIRRIKSQCSNPVCCIGTSATMVSVGDHESQRNKVAEVAGLIFGCNFKPEQIIDETLDRSLGFGSVLPTEQALKTAVTGDIDVNAPIEALKAHPVAIWFEDEIALDEKEGRLGRRKPIAIDEVVEKLAQDSGCSKEECDACLNNMLLWISRVNETIRATGSKDMLLPYKLHQFIAQTGSVYTTLDQEEENRFITLDPGIYKDEEKKKPIYPNVFSRGSGHAFICVSLGKNRLLPREFREVGDDEEREIDGYLIVGEDIWNPDEDLDNLPNAWVRTQKDGTLIPTSAKKDRFPKKIYFDETGSYSESKKMKYWGWFMRTPLLFDPTSGVFHESKTNEGTKLTKLGSEGRATSTTITAFSILNGLYDSKVDPLDQKVLSFTDNRQDAALQSGHFNDYIQVVRFRSGLNKALTQAPGGVLNYTNIGEAIFSALALPTRDYSAFEKESPLPHVRRKYESAFQELLLYRALEDLRRSWRIVLPNLEQCALLEVDYSDLDEVAANDEFWSDLPIVADFGYEKRRDFISAVLDFYRLERAIHSENFLTPAKLRENEKRFRENLKSPWTIESDEELFRPNVIRLDKLHSRARVAHKSMGANSALGKYIKQIANEVSGDPANYKGDNYKKYMLILMHKLVEADYLHEETMSNAKNEDISVFRLKIDKILWKRGDGETVKPDVIKRRSYKPQDLKPNQFFKEVYQRDYTQRKRLRAEDHTGQLGSEIRQEREDQFRAEWFMDNNKQQPDTQRILRDSISALFCSPTMELGVDIGSLGVVHMRNVPPNPSNYAQRSGRAGRSGQGALIFTYCSSYSPHDRHYFERQAELVAGEVQAPRLDLCNEELLHTHLNALTISRIGFPALDTQNPSLEDLLTKEHPDLPLSPSVKDGLNLSTKTLDEIKASFQRAIKDFSGDPGKKAAAWYTDEWIDRKLGDIADNLDGAMNRWRTIHHSANDLLRLASRQLESGRLQVNSKEYKKHARLQAQATRQLNLLRNDQGRSAVLSEFYPFRYLAAEGFLPGYNFTRLPVRIFVPTDRTSGEYISRPRSVALREFGPLNIIYHNGRKYRVSRTTIQSTESPLAEARISTGSGYYLPADQKDLEICPFSEADLSDNTSKLHLHDLLELSECHSEEITRITCEEEERMSRGFNIDKYFTIDGGDMDRIQEATVGSADIPLLRLRYIPAARLVDVNHGWKNQKEEGFLIGMTSGNWSGRNLKPDAQDNEEHRLVRLWTSNVSDALYIEPIQALGLTPDGVITLQHALKRAVETVFQVESGEIGVNLMGNAECPNILIYEAAEGSLGILSQLLEEPEAFHKVIESAQEICRFDDEEYKAPASYKDLLSYFNQSDHQAIDRHLIKDALEKLKAAKSEIQSNSNYKDYEDHYQHMIRDLDQNSSTERALIEHLYKNGLRLPDEAQKRVPGQYCQPDFYYHPRTWIFCDGTPHDQPSVQEKDEEQRQLIISRGDEVWAWHYKEDLAAKVAARPDIFKKVR